MTLKTQMTTDMATFYNADEFADDTVTYTPTGGSPTTITAIVDKDDIFQEPYVRGPETAICEIRVQVSEVSNPQFGDTFTIDSVVWELDPSRGVLYSDGYIFIIALERQF